MYPDSDSIIDLLEHARYREAKEKIVELPDTYVFKPYYKVKFLRERNELTKGIKLANQYLNGYNSVQIVENCDSDISQVYFRLLGEKAYLLYLQGSYEESLSTINHSGFQIQLLNKECQEKLRGIELFLEFTRGNMEVYRGASDKGLSILKQVLSRLQHSDQIRLRSFVLNDIGSIYYRRGDLAEAIQYFNRSLKLKEEFGNPNDIAFTFNNLGLLYYNKGELEKAQQLFNRSLKLFETIGNDLDAAFANDLLGLIHYSKNQYSDALEYIKKGLSLRLISKNDVLISSSLLNLILVNLAMDNIRDIDVYLTDMGNLCETSISNLPHLYYQYANGVVLKSTTLMKSKVKSMYIFESIIDTNPCNFEIVYNSMYNLCDLYLEEFTIFQNQSIFEKAKDLVNRIVEYARTSNSYIKIIEALILESKFELLDSNYELAVQILEHANLIATQQNLPHLKHKVTNELSSIEHELEELKLLVDRNSSLIDRIMVIGLKDYITKAGLMYHQE